MGTVTMEKTSDNPYEYAKQIIDELYQETQAVDGLKDISQTDFELLLMQNTETNTVLYEVLKERNQNNKDLEMLFKMLDYVEKLEGIDKEKEYE